MRRLPAEVILDAYSQVTGVPTPFTQVESAAGDSASAYDGYPLGTRAVQLPDSLVSSRFLEAFGRPERVATLLVRTAGRFQRRPGAARQQRQDAQRQAARPKGRVEAWLKEKVGDDEAVRRLYLLALSREPTAAEAKKFHDLLADAAADGKTTRREALEDLFWAVLASKEFVFNH